MKEMDLMNMTDNVDHRFQALHHQLVASALAVMMGHEIDSDNKVGCMQNFVMNYALTCKLGDVIATQQINHIRNWFCSDIQCRGKYPNYMKRYFKDNNIKFRVEERDAEILAEGTVDFYTCSYYMTVCQSLDVDKQKEGEGNIFKGLNNPYLKTSGWGWQIDPEGLGYSLNEI